MYILVGAKVSVLLTELFFSNLLKKIKVFWSTLRNLSKAI